MSPTYVVEEKLGKGGFGQVYIGRRRTASNATEGADANKVPSPPASIHSWGAHAPTAIIGYLYYTAFPQINESCAEAIIAVSI